MSKPSLPKLPKEAVRFAKSMGLDLDGLEPEAEDIWKMLDELSRTNPIQYDQFIAQQLANGKDDPKVVSSDNERRSFRPTAGYCVETRTTGGDGLKVRDVGSEEGKKLYINLCSSVVIEEPTDKAGKPIVGTRSVADGLSIPLIVGPLRGSGTSFQSKEKDLFVDVVLNPKVLEMCSRERYFKAQVVDLAFDWVLKETKVESKRSWEFVTDATYKGGRGDAGDVPVLFFVDQNGAPVGQSDFTTEQGAAGTGSGEKVGKVMESTASLLSQLNKEKSAEQDAIGMFSAEPNITIGSSSSKGGVKEKGKGKSDPSATPASPKKPLIQEVGAEPFPPPSSVPAPSAPAPTAGAGTVPAPSSNGKGTAKSSGGAAQSAHSASSAGPAPASAATTPSTAAPPPAQAAACAPSAPAVSAPSKMEYSSMERLLSSYDDEFATVTGPLSDPMALDLDSANNMIAGLAKVLCGDLGGGLSAPGAPTASKTDPKPPAAPAKKSIADRLTVRNDAPAAVQVTVSTEITGSATGVLTLTILGLSSSLDTSALELLVSAGEVQVLLQPQHVQDTAAASAALTALTAQGKGGKQRALIFGAQCGGAGCRLLEGTAAAAYKKKKGALTVRVDFKMLN